MLQVVDVLHPGRAAVPKVRSLRRSDKDVYGFIVPPAHAARKSDVPVILADRDSGEACQHVRRRQRGVHLSVWLQDAGETLLRLKAYQSLYAGR